MLLNKIVITNKGRIAQLLPGMGNNQQARASDVNTVIDAVNDLIKTTDSSPVPVAINATATATPAQVASGWITSTSAAGTTITLPSVSLVCTALGITPTAGDSFELVIDNSAGASTVTLAVDAGTTFAVSTPAITGGDTLTITTANVYGGFKFIFKSSTSAVIYRIF